MLRLFFALLFHPYRRALWHIAVHESGNFRNTISKQHNNFFSYGYNGGSPYQSGGSPGHFAHYSSALNAVKDVTGWFERRPKALTALKAYNASPSKQTAYVLAAEMSANKYFTAPYTHYANGLLAADSRYPSYLFNDFFAVLCVLLIVCVLFGIGYLCVLLLRAFRY